MSLSAKQKLESHTVSFACAKITFRQPIPFDSSVALTLWHCLFVYDLYTILMHRKCLAGHAEVIVVQVQIVVTFCFSRIISVYNAMLTVYDMSAPYPFI